MNLKYDNVKCCSVQVERPSRELLRQLDRMSVERRPEVCFGCGLEHNCARDGCAALRKAADLLRQ